MAVFSEVKPAGDGGLVWKWAEGTAPATDRLHAPAVFTVAEAGGRPGGSPTAEWLRGGKSPRSSVPRMRP